MAKQESKKSDSRSSAKDVFSYLLMVSMLYVGVVSFITMLWQYTNVQFPDPLELYYNGSLEMIRGAISALVIVWPVMMGMSWLINKDIKNDKHKKNLWIRKWLLYLTLFISALTIIVDLISVTNNFLSGELTTRFALKIVIVLVVALAVFSYCMWELQRDVQEKTLIPKISATVTSVLIVAFVIIGFFIVGSPKSQRAVRMDNQRVSDLQSIQYQILNHWQQKEILPTNIEALKDPLYGVEMQKDPITGTAYEYVVTGELSFKLCATFSASSQMPGASYSTAPVMIDYSGYGRDMMNESWFHDNGYTCFDRAIDPELYKPIKN